LKELITILNKLGACEEAMEWLSLQASLEEAWESCEQGCWLLWLVTALKMNERKLFLAKGLIANEIIHLMDDERSKAAVQAAIDFGRGKINKNELEKAAAAAREAVTDIREATYDNISTDAAYAAYAAAAAAAFSSIVINYVVDTSIDLNDSYENVVNNSKKLLRKSTNIIKKIYSLDEIKRALAL